LYLCFLVILQKETYKVSRKDWLGPPGSNLSCA
jgi:hypothetical protein